MHKFRQCTVPLQGNDGYLMIGSVVCRVRGGGRGSGLGGANAFPFLAGRAGGSLNLRGKSGLVLPGDCLTTPNEAPPWPGTGVGMPV